METRRFMLIAVLGVILYFMYQAWQTDYPSAKGEPTPAAKAAAAAASQPAGGSTLIVGTDRLLLRLDLATGQIRQARLLDFSVAKEHPADKFDLLDDTAPHWFVFETGVRGGAAPALACSAPSDRYVLADGSDTLDVPLHCKAGDSLQVDEVLHLQRGSYTVGVQQSVSNVGAQPVSPTLFARFVHNNTPSGEAEKSARSFFGLGLYQQEGGQYRFKKYKFSDLDKKTVDLQQGGGWLAMLQHYFVAAVIPPAGAPLTLHAARVEPDRYVGEAELAAEAIAPGAKRTAQWTVYVGPKTQTALAAVAPGFELTEDYGWARFFAGILFKALAWLHNLTGNWGWAIVLLTIAVKVLFYPLSEAQYRSAAKMRKFGPRMQELRERYGQDRERLQKAMMDLYKKEGFNPLAGCWPILVQTPIFLALYWVLVESVELRQANFALWLKDLSSPDPYYVLPVLYGVSMWVQQRQSGQTATMDPTQAKMMNVMPIALTGLFAFFPAGLVLYWFVSNLIGIAQQTVIQRRMARAEERVRR